MEDYSKLFNDNAEYNTYKNEHTNDIPIYSHCIEEVNLNYSPETYVIGIFEVTDTANPTTILGSTSNIKRIFVDGIKSTPITSYTFNTLGTHVIRYALSKTTNVASNMFKNCSNLVNAIIPSAVKTMGEQVFRYCSNLRNVNISSNVTKFNYALFQMCDSLTNFTVSDNVTNIEGYVFCGCHSLTSCTIGSSVTSIGLMGFRESRNLKTVICKPTTPPTLSSDVFLYNAIDRKFYVPSQSLELYKTATNWTNLADYIFPLPQ